MRFGEKEKGLLVTQLTGKGFKTGREGNKMQRFHRGPRSSVVSAAQTFHDAPARLHQGIVKQDSEKLAFHFSEEPARCQRAAAVRVTAGCCRGTCSEIHEQIIFFFRWGLYPLWLVITPDEGPCPSLLFVEGIENSWRVARSHLCLSFYYLPRTVKKKA